MSQFDNVIFGKKKFSDVLEEIYNNQKKKDQQVNALISELKPLISDIGDATLRIRMCSFIQECDLDFTYFHFPLQFQEYFTN